MPEGEKMTSIAAAKILNFHFNKYLAREIKAANLPLNRYLASPARALLVIDMLKDFFKGGTLEIKDGEAIVDNVNKAIIWAHAGRMFVAFAADHHAPDDPEFQSWPKHCV